MSEGGNSTMEFSDINNIVPALRALKPGEQMVYYRGDLAYDREDRRNTDKTNINFIANTAFELHLKRKVCLTQRRVSYFKPGSPPVWEYIATGCFPPAYS